MIEFVSGPHGETVSSKERKFIEQALAENSDSYNINRIYNNGYHFSSQQYTYETSTFLRELSNLIQSQFHKIVIMGGVHSDPYGHSSGLIGQYGDYGEFFPSIVKDNYIRFKVVMEKKHMKALRALDETHIFHYLITTPEITQLQLNVHYPIALPDYNYPLQSRYKRLTFSG
jgi:hypothetical protein